MTTDLAAALLKDVQRLSPSWVNLGEMLDDEHGEYVVLGHVLAALSRALDPAIAERAGEVVPKLHWHREHPVTGKLVYANEDGPDAADLLTALLAQNAALRAERDEHRKNWERAFNANTALEERLAAAEAKVEKLREAAEGLSAILDKNETKGPLPDTALMLCWLAAQNVRAVLRGYMLEKTE